MAYEMENRGLTNPNRLDQRDLKVYLIKDGTNTGERITVLPFVLGGDIDNIGKGVHTIKREAWMDHFKREIPEYDLYVERQRLQDHYARPGNLHLAVLGTDVAGRHIVENDEVIGYVNHRPIYGLIGKVASKLNIAREVFQEGMTPRHAYPHNVDVLPDYQQRGVGSALLHVALSVYPPDAGVRLDVVGVERERVKADKDYTQEWFERLGLSYNPDEVLPPTRNLKLPQIRYDGATVAEVRSNLKKEFSVRPEDH